MVEINFLYLGECIKDPSYVALHGGKVKEENEARYSRSLPK